MGSRIHAGAKVGCAAVRSGARAGWAASSSSVGSCVPQRCLPGQRTVRLLTARRSVLPLDLWGTRVMPLAPAINLPHRLRCRAHCQGLGERLHSRSSQPLGRFGRCGRLLGPVAGCRVLGSHATGITPTSGPRRPWGRLVGWGEGSCRAPISGSFFVLRGGCDAQCIGFATEDEETGPSAHFLFLGPSGARRGGRCSAQTTN